MQFHNYRVLYLICYTIGSVAVRRAAGEEIIKCKVMISKSSLNLMTQEAQHVSISIFTRKHNTKNTHLSSDFCFTRD